MELQFSTVRERDIDLLFLEAISTDKDFIKLIIDKTKWQRKDFSVEKVELSRTDPKYGESDITVTVSIDGSLYGILIEDKIDAIAMPEQHGRYIKRAKASVKSGEYADFEIFITCSQKYYDGNTEAKKYEHFLSYEECRDYFAGKSDEISKVRAAWMNAAIERSHKPYEANIDQAAYEFFGSYREYQQTHFPTLDLRTKRSSNGWWPQYGSVLGQTLIYHKMQEGYVDLTFPNTAEQMDTMQEIASWLRDNGNDQITAVRTGKSISLRIECPKLKVKENFDNTSPNDLNVCFNAISRLTEIAAIFAKAGRMSTQSKGEQ